MNILLTHSVFSLTCKYFINFVQRRLHIHEFYCLINGISTLTFSIKKIVRRIEQMHTQIYILYVQRLHGYKVTFLYDLTLLM